MPIFRVKSVKIYTGQKNLHWRRQPRQRQLWGMLPPCCHGLFFTKVIFAMNIKRSISWLITKRKWHTVSTSDSAHRRTIWCFGPKWIKFQFWVSKLSFEIIISQVQVLSFIGSRSDYCLASSCHFFPKYVPFVKLPNQAMLQFIVFFNAMLSHVFVKVVTCISRKNAVAARFYG